VELEHRDNVLVVAHQAMLRCVFGYILSKPMESVPFVKIPQHAIMQVTFEGEDNVVVDFIRLPVDHVENGITLVSQDGNQPQQDEEEVEEEDAGAECARVE